MVNFLFKDWLFFLSNFLFINRIISILFINFPFFLIFFIIFLSQWLFILNNEFLKLFALLNTIICKFQKTDEPTIISINKLEFFKRVFYFLLKFVFYEVYIAFELLKWDLSIVVTINSFKQNLILEIKPKIYINFKIKFPKL